MNILDSALTTIKPRVDELGTDRLNYYYTTMIIVAMFLTMSARQYVGSPLQCFVPHQFSTAWEQYAESYCMVYNTYFVSPTDDIPDKVEARDSRQLIYYQWVPFILVLEAGFFHLPGVFWSQVSSKSGLNVSSIVQLARGADSEEDSEKKIRSLELICRWFSNSVRLQRGRRAGTSAFRRCLHFGTLSGSYITRYSHFAACKTTTLSVYIITKLFYLMNIVGQFLLTNQFLGQHDHLWGMHITRDILTGTDWELSGNFPRITMCDFEVRLLGNRHRYSIQCVLVLNMFNEKLFLFLYWWFLTVTVATFIDLTSLVRASRDPNRFFHYTQRYIQPVDKSEENELLEFCEHSMNSDLLLIMRMISAHCSELLSTELLQHMIKSSTQQPKSMLVPVSVEETPKATSSSQRPLIQSSDENLS